MKVHLFGNTSSPAIATCALRKTALVGEPEYGPDEREFVEKDVYVDDGLKSVPDREGAIDLLHRTKTVLADANLRLHKIASNDPTVTQPFPIEDRASDLRNLDHHRDVVPIQRSLGYFGTYKQTLLPFKSSTEPNPLQDVAFSPSPTAFTESLPRSSSMPKSCCEL